ncbi:MAG: Gfo/Idh/MocA family oxidoreductase [Chitinophagales bacterium]|nr:Gfo/Idh/MocA family oxidoreductase [Chitinophagales bacterium]
MQTLKAAIIGIGRHGSIHLDYFQRTSYFDLVGCFDQDEDKLKRVHDDYSVAIFDHADELIDLAEVVVICTPAKFHHYYAEKAIKKGKHVFIESPITLDLEEAEHILELSNEANVKVQIGHIDRFNPVFAEAQNMDLHPIIIESNRAGIVNQKRISKSVIFELMIHDIDLILSLVHTNIKKIEARGATIMSEQADDIFAQISFDNGTIALLHAYRTHEQRIKKLNITENSRRLSLDLIKRNFDYTTLSNKPIHNAKAIVIHGKKKYITQQFITTVEYNSFSKQMESFALAIIENHEPKVSAEDGYKALKIAHEILLKSQRWDG